MNDAQIHLTLNHFSIIGSLFGVALLGYGVIRRQRSITHAGYITLIIVALITIPVFITGGGAEEIVEDLGVSHEVIHEHEELAETAIWLVEILGILALAGFVLSTKEHQSRRLVSIITLIFGLIVFGFLVRVGDAGGEIRHTELREDTDVPKE